MLYRSRTARACCCPSVGWHLARSVQQRQLMEYRKWQDGKLRLWIRYYNRAQEVGQCSSCPGCNL